MKHSDIDHTGLTGVGGSDAGDIAITDSGTYYTGTDVEAALQEVGADLAALSGGVADQGAFTYLDATEAAAPATPATGYARIYAKTDGRIYSKDDAGVEYGPFDAAGAGGGTDPLLYADSLALHADGTDFADDTLSDCTLVGISIPSEVTAVTTEPYDATCLDIVFAAQGDRLYIPAPAGNFTAYLTLHGITNSTPSPAAARGAMIGMSITDNSGTGVGVSPYDDNNTYGWSLASNVYSGTLAGVGGFQTVAPPAASNWPVILKLAKSGTTITFGVSINGGLFFAENTTTNSTTFTRINVVRMNSGGGTNPTLRVGRLNIV